MNSGFFLKLITLAALFLLLAITATAQETSDNCCFTGRECTTNDDWYKGYYDYQRGQCHITPPTPVAASTNDNICFTDWAGFCLTDDDFTAGWYVHQYGCLWTWRYRPHLRSQLTNKGNRSCRPPASTTSHISIAESDSGPRNQPKRVSSETTPTTTTCIVPSRSYQCLMVPRTREIFCGCFPTGSHLPYITVSSR